MYTELSSINRVLRAGQEATITDVNSTDEEVVSVKQYLEDSRMHVLLMGLAFNKKTVTFTGGGVSGLRIAIDRTLYVRVEPPAYCDWIVEYDSVEAGYFLYDRDKQTFDVLTDATQEQKLTVVQDIPFIHMPDAVQNYVTQRAAFFYVNESIGDANLVRSIQVDLEMARQEMNRHQIKVKKPNMFSPRDERLRNQARLRRF